ncbi:MAG: MBL fold metallo-hydrolase [Oscillospiraceae bacterium]
MKIQYLGTAASEGWPALFCKCEACEKAHKLGGKDIRTRSQSIVDNKLLIDMPADSYMHSLQYGIDFSSLENVLITHSHEDHFTPLDIILKAPPYAHGGKAKSLHIYGNNVIVKILKQAMDESGISNICDYIIPVQVEPFTPFRVGEYQVTALLGNHMPNENCYIYIIEKDQKRLLYGHDTGVFPKKTWEYIKGITFDAVSLDCTFVLGDNAHGHMGLPNCNDVKQEMQNIGSASVHTTFIINHFSHNGNKTHEELSDAANELGFLTAYDGMTVNI